MRNFIVTGTDTEVGKTYVSCLIVKSLREAGINAAGFKPVACGDRQDARLLREAGPKDLTLDELNPVFLRNATCPYVAARLEKRLSCGLMTLCPPHMSAWWWKGWEDGKSRLAPEGISAIWLRISSCLFFW